MLGDKAKNWFTVNSKNKLRYYVLFLMSIVDRMLQTIAVISLEVERGIHGNFILKISSFKTDFADSVSIVMIRCQCLTKSRWQKEMFRILPPES